jgi:hypothetical protein
MNMERLYRMLLKLYPYEHRLRFGDEMLSVFEQVALERRAQGRFVYARFLLRESGGVLGGACAERLRTAPLAPALGAVLLAAVLHGAFYSVIFKALRTISAAACRAELPLADHRAAGLIAALLAVLSLLCLLPVFFLMSIRLIRRSR